MKTKITIIILALGLSLNTQAQFIVPFTSAPTIDGVIDNNDPWGNDWILQEKETESSSTHNMTSKFQISHNSGILYIVVSVVDSTPNNDETAIPYPSHRDGVETYFSFKFFNINDSTFTESVQGIRCQRAAERYFIDGPYYLVNSGDIKYGVVSDTNSYIVELAFNLNALSGESDFDDANFKFDIGAVDNTKGTNEGITQEIFWNSNSELHWLNSVPLGDMVLEGIEPDYLHAKFSADNTSGYVPLTVSFKNESSGTPIAWSWDFNNDGIEDSNAQNPTYTYTEIGNYTVTLTVTDANHSKSLTKDEYINITKRPTADYIVPLVSAPKIDGIVDDNDPWGDTWISQDYDYGGPSTTFNMTSKFQIIHDGNFIYVAVSVQDSTPSTDTAAIPNSYERDCVETYFSFKSTNFDEGEFTNGDHLIRCQRANVDGKYIDGLNFYNYNYLWSYNSLVTSGDIKYGVASDTNGYVIEMAFNFNTLAEGSNFDGVNFRFEIITTDNTTGEPGYRTQRKAWYSSMETAVSSTRYFGNMTLFGLTDIGPSKYEQNTTSLQIYPNPVSKILTFSSPKNVESATIINLQGQVVYKTTGNVLKNEKYQINVSELPRGIYLLKADSMVKRIVIQ